MFGSDDQNQNSDLPAGRQSGSATGEPVDPAMPVIDADAPASGSSAAPDVVSSAPSAPTLSDPMVTPSVTTASTGTTQPDLSTDLPTEASAEAGAPGKVEVGVNGVSIESANIGPTAQAGAVKPSQPDAMPTAASMTSTNTNPMPAVGDDDLAQIKQQALQSLEPLVGQLEQAPDEKFRTVMMLVQASDNSRMLKEAYEAASQIQDEKVRAQALLDIVNEANYFTQQAKQ